MWEGPNGTACAICDKDITNEENHVCDVEIVVKKYHDSEIKRIEDFEKASRKIDGLNNTIKKQEKEIKRFLIKIKNKNGRIKELEGTIEKIKIKRSELISGG